ncbi:MAG: P-type conjugative transfer protein TrbL [Proteobacteria bacterium]|nr:P-type conjugative transfer protein TrbL [Pseudomonadota bacterium]MBU2452893.1 P-type conjugative transfer protein TrbL [Pseudomonadota bacterium]MBU2631682.1 P-type conjugative transfer protein TrbL [Pseudomonadota bacterium]
MRKKSFLLSSLFLLFMLILLESAQANAPTNNLSDTIINTYRNAAAQWLPLISAYAQRLFWLLAILDFTYMGIVLILKNGDFYDFVFNLVRKILFFGFFYALLLNGNQWMMAIVNSFRTIAANVPGGAGAITPGTILENAFDVYMAACQKMSITSPQSWMIGVAGIGIVIIGALMTAIQVLVLIEMYLAVIVGQIMLGFGGSEWSKDYAVSFVKYIVSVGLKLMAIQLIAAMANNLFTGWANIPAAQFDLHEVAALVIAMLLLFFIMKTIPEIISGIISGGQFGSNPVSVLGSAVAMGAGMVMGGIGMAAGGAGGVAKSMAVLREATKAPGNTGGIGSTIATIAGAGVRTVADNMGRAAAFRSPIIGGTYANLREQRQKSELNNLDKGD